MNTTYLTLTPQDSIIARDGRPFGAGQGNRMRSLSWPLPSVVAGSFRTALVKASESLDFDGCMPTKLMAIDVAGVFPCVGTELYLPAPNDCVWDEMTGTIHRVQPVKLEKGEGVDFTTDGLRPVRLTAEQAKDDFKAKTIPGWWPVSQLTKWLIGEPVNIGTSFLQAAVQETRDHVAIDEQTGAAKDSHIYSTTGLNVHALPRFGVKQDDKKLSFEQRFAKITLATRVSIADTELQKVKLDHFHPLGGERRLVHWQHSEANDLWKCPEPVRIALKDAKTIRMVLATPAIFACGWKPGWLKDGLVGTPPRSTVKLKLVGVSNGRWKAVSGWSLAPPRGPKPIRRMVPAGSVYFFEKVDGDSAMLADRWLQSVCDGEQDRRDGFGLAVWGTW